MVIGAVKDGIIVRVSVWYEERPTSLHLKVSQV